MIAPKATGWILDQRDADRFWSRVNLNGGTAHEPDPLATASGDCWLWTGHTNGKYGQFMMHGRKKVAAHRVSFMDSGNNIPSGHVLDHLCRNKICVNPRHLEAVTQCENMARGSRAKATHCKHGHEYTPENTRYAPKGGARWCRTCNAIRR